MTLETFLDTLASAAPAPGGGAAVGFTGAQAAALLSMVLNVTGEGGPNLSPMARKHLLGELETMRRRFAELADEDAAAFSAVMRTYKMPQKTDTEKASRAAALQTALKGATKVPLDMMDLFDQLLGHAEAIIPTAKATVVSDAAIAVLLAEAGLRAARFNVLINLKYLKDGPFIAETEQTTKLLLKGKKAKRRALLAQAKQMIASSS